MSRYLTRRSFLHSSATTGATAAVGALGFFSDAGPICAEQLALTPAILRMSPNTEPIVKLILDTPRESCIEVIAGQFAKGMPYRHFLAALYLAAIRAGLWHSNPFDHNAYVVHSAHQLALDLPPQEMLLPLLWALDSLKTRPLEPESLPITLASRLPAGQAAMKELRAGIEARDDDRAVCAILGLSRSQGAAGVGEAIWEFASRDWTFIGHLSILASNSWRLLQVIGWQHAEPVLRYIVSGFAGTKNSTPDLQHFAENTARVDANWKSLPGDWATAAGDSAFTRELTALIRARKADEACDAAVSRLASGKCKAGAIWDAVFLAAGEMIACAQKNSTPLHANTAANALRFAFGESSSPRTRLLILLQAVAWMTRFRAAMFEQDWFKNAVDITQLAGEEVAAEPVDAARNILDSLSQGGQSQNATQSSSVPGWHGLSYNHQPWRLTAAKQAFALARQSGGTETLFQAAARLLPAKADGDPHRVKFATAMFENHGWVSSEWRPHLAAAATYSFLGADAPDTSTIERIRSITAS